MAKTSRIAEIASSISRAHLAPEFRAAMTAYRAAGFVDEDGDIAFVPGDSQEPVADMFARARDAGDWVTFVTHRDNQLEFQPTRRGPSGTGTSEATAMPFGTTVSEWFDAVRTAPDGTSWRADGVPDSIPMWVVESDQVLRVEVAAKAY